MKKSVVLARQNSYGAIELKKWIEVYTIRAFFLALGIFALPFLLMLFKSDAKINLPSISLVNDDYIAVDIPEFKSASNLPAGSVASSANPSAANAQSKSLSGSIVPVTDNLILDKGNLDFGVGDVTVDEIGDKDKSSATNSGGGNGNGEKSISPVVSDEPDPEIFFEGQEPTFDYAELQRNVEYPSLARQVGIDGVVVVQALISENGEVIKANVVQSDNIMLNDNAVKAIKKFRGFRPAIQDKKNVKCWVTIPIKFRLR